MYFIWENEIRGVFFYLNPSINEPLYYYESHLSANLATVDIDAAVKGTGADVIDGALQAEAESGRGGAGIRFIYLLHFSGTERPCSLSQRGR